jgi:penicillin-binding protein 1C
MQVNVARRLNLCARVVAAMRRLHASLGYTRLTKLGLLAVGLAATGALGLNLAYPLPPEAQPNATTPSTLVVTAEDGTPLRTWPGADGALRQPITMADVSPHYLQALLTFEDRWFRWHPGVNPLALGRAAWQWASEGHVVSGGSTLTMQVARILDPPAPSRSLFTKAKQMARAIHLEMHLSKDEILTLYLNHAPMGGQVEGVEMASRAYLGKSARDLSPAEAALLVALPQTPSRLRPDRAPGAAQIARDKVLTRMQTLGVWDAALVNDAKLERVFAPPLKARWLSPLAAQRLKSESLHAQRRHSLVGVNPSGNDGLSHKTSAVLRSTLDPAVQSRLEQILLDRLPRLPDAVSIAALIVDNETLAVRGYAGSADFSDTARAAHVDMVRAVRSPGSTLKPFLYAMALDEGLIHSESLLIDAPQNFGGYAPGNFQAAFTGPVSVSEALQRSLNVPAVDLLERLGPARFSAHLRNAELKLRLPQGAEPNLSLILGGGGTTLEELVGAYTALARGGVAGKPRLTPDAPLVETRLMSEGAAFIVREILENGGRPDAPFRETNTRVAWKTGTSFGFRDAWAIGVTDSTTVGVWVGRPDGTPNPGYFGANTAAPLVKDVLAALAATQTTTTKPRHQPPEVTAQEICWPLGLAASQTEVAHCLHRRSAWALNGTTPPTLPDRVRPGSLMETAWVTLGKASHRVHAGCLGNTLVQAQPHARWPALLEPWIEGDWRSSVERLPIATACNQRNLKHTAQRSLRISGIEPGSVLRPSPGHKELTVLVRAVGSSQPITWLLNGRMVGTSGAGQTSLKLTLPNVGAQALTALDTQGRYERVEFRVQNGLMVPGPVN